MLIRRKQEPRAPLQPLPSQGSTLLQGSDVTEGNCGIKYKGCKSGNDRRIVTKKYIPVRSKSLIGNPTKSLASPVTNSLLPCQQNSKEVGNSTSWAPVSCQQQKYHLGGKLLQPKIIVQRVPLFGSSSLLGKKFTRPCLKRRAYSKDADLALKQCSLGQKRRFDSMSKILARAGRPLSYKLPQSAAIKATDNGDGDCDSDENDEEEEKKDTERPFEPLEVWKSPHQGGRLIGLPSQTVCELRCDEFGIEEEVTVLKPAPIAMYSKNSIFVPAPAAKWLRPHQREGVKFMYECVMGLKDYNGNGCILADDMGLGKTLQSVSLIYTLIKTGITSDGVPTAKRVIVVCPCSLVKNWENEFIKWFGLDPAIKTEALADQSRKEVEKAIDSFCKTRIKNILIASYECIRMHVDRLKKYKDCCDLLVCDEAHRLKNSENQTSRALDALPVKRRVLLTGTPMQNDLQEFYAMVNFTNPMILGTQEEFRRTMLFPILRGREPDATEKQKQKMLEIQNDISTIVNDFILRRINTLNAQHLPPKLVQVVCCNLTEIQKNMYQHLISSKDTQHLLEGKQTNCLASIQLLMKLSNHPTLVAEDDRVFQNTKPGSSNLNRRSTAKTIKYNDDPEKEVQSVPGADGISRFLPYVGGGDSGRVHPEWSGKMYVLFRLMKEMRKPGNGNDKIVIISNYTQTLDLIGRMCRENNWGFCRLDGSVTMKKRQRMVEDFNDPGSSLIAFLLSSKAGGCGLNLIGGNRLVLFDPDWNPAVDKQAAARCWRDGQRKRCFTYRFLATGTVEEKIFQRQLSKEGLQSVVDDKEQVNALSTKDLRNLFKFRHDTPSDTHDKLRCERCKIIHDTAEMEAATLLPKKLRKCQELLEEMISLYEESQYFLKPLDPISHGRTKEQYENLVKQPMDFETIQTKIAHPIENTNAYKSITAFSKDVNRVFGNVLKVWIPGEDIADAARRLQAIWIEKWTNLVPVLMALKATDNDEDASNKQQEAEESVLDEVYCSTLNNERSDDYQEQIGMPDEENMRHWSHHYCTDTVDDPVFRAAMRGTDAVSFVFGLEVTWDLIQQRKEEEEERMAMAAMECIPEERENENDNIACVDGDVSDCKPSAKADTEISVILAGCITDENEPMTLLEDSGDENNDDNSPSHTTTTKIDNDSSDDVDDDDSLVLDSLGKKDITNSDQPKKTRKDELHTNDEANSYNEEISTKSSSPRRQLCNGEWSCVSCTFLNGNTLRSCKICGVRRPRVSNGSSVSKKKRER